MRHLISLLFHDVYASTPGESGFSGAAADHYKLPLREFGSQLRRLDAVLKSPLWRVTDAAPPEGGVPVAVTVDDCGLSYHAIAELLEGRGWRGHCFVTTDWIGRPGFLHARHLRELAGRGHVIGSHSVTHPARFASLEPAAMFREWHDSRAQLQDLLGSEVTAASVPGGYFSPRVAEAAAEAGIRFLFTSEPEARIRRIGGCQVFGRYAIRRGDAVDYPARLARGSLPATSGAWLAWNAKKLPKALLGANYAGLSTWLGRLERRANP